MGPTVDMKAKNTEDFIRLAREVHGDLYDYSKTQLNTTRREAVLITCKIHGDFYMRPENHLKGLQCPECSTNSYKDKAKAIPLDKFIEKSKKKFGDYFNYDNTKYFGNTYVSIQCPKHGDIITGIISHLHSKTGCQECSFDRRRKSQDDAIKKLKEVHGDKYDYSEVDFKNIRTKMKIICPQHGPFYQTYKKHSKGIGCPECGKRVRVVGTDLFKEHMYEKYGDRYDLSEVDYYNSKTKVTVTCNRCGRKFDMRPNDLLTGHGCPCFDNGVSSAEHEFYNFIKSVHQTAEHNSRFLIDSNYRSPREIDVYIKDLSLGFEYDGIYWHSESVNASGRYNLLEKNSLGKAHGVKIYHIFEDEWVNKRELTERKICNILRNGERILSSMCYMRDIPFDKCKTLIEDNSLNPWVEYTNALGYYKGGQLISIATYTINDNTVDVNEIVHTSNAFVVNELRNMLQCISELNPGKTVRYIVDARFNHREDLECEWLAYCDTTTPSGYGVKGVNRLAEIEGCKHVIYDCGKIILIYNNQYVKR